MSEWISTKERLPEKPGIKDYEYVECLIVVYGRVEWGHWNCEHECWDDDAYDDHRYDAEDPSHWMPLPEPPASTHNPEKEE